MPWTSGTVMDKRLEFIRLAELGDLSMTQLCRRFGISRETGYVYLRRYRASGLEGLAVRSSRPHRSPQRTSAAMEERITALRAEHPAWGGPKLARRLKDLGVADVPAASTVTEVLRRHGKLATVRKVPDEPLRRFARAAPNELWQMDFKGHVAMDQGRCHPLTVLDDHSRYLIGLKACGDETQQTVRGHLTTLFRCHGMPLAMLCDNGSPWGGSGAQGFTELEVWLLRCGVRMYHGRPYHPQTQGKDERFHRTLKIELLQNRRITDLLSCQPMFDRYLRVYNEERPHHALDLAVPARRYCSSVVSFPEHLARPEYYQSDKVRRVHADGAISFQGRRAKLSQAFRELDVALRPDSVDGTWRVYFSRFLIARLDLRDPHTDGAALRKASTETGHELLV